MLRIDCVSLSIVSYIDGSSIVEKISSSSTNAVAVIVPSDIEPNWIVPLDVMFLRVPISLFESTTSALDAATVPAVIPSIVSSSDSLITADPIVNPVAVTTPDDVIYHLITAHFTATVTVVVYLSRLYAVSF